MYCLLSSLYKSLYWIDLLWPVYYIPTVLGHVTMYCLLSGLYKSLYWIDLLWPVYYIPTVLGHVTMYCLLSGLYNSLYWIDLLWLTILWYFLALQNWLLRGVTSCRGKYLPTIYFFYFFFLFLFLLSNSIPRKTYLINSSWTKS